MAFLVRLLPAIAVTRIFIIFSIVSLGLLAASAILGFTIGGYNAAFLDVKPRLIEIQQQIHALQARDGAQDSIQRLQRQQAHIYAQYEPVKRRATLHMVFGLVSAIAVMLVSSMSVTHFVGASRWCREVAEAYGIDPQLAGRSARLKRRAFPWAVTSMLIVVGISALGAAANPGTIREGTAPWATVHLIGALAGAALVALTFFRQAVLIADHHVVIEQVTEQVRQIRRQRGLPEN